MKGFRDFSIIIIMLIIFIVSNYTIAAAKNVVVYTSVDQIFSEPILNPEAGKTLIDYLLSKEVESRIAFSESANMPLRDDVKKPEHIPDVASIKAMEVDYYKLAEQIKQSAKFCQRLFIR